MKKRHFCKAGQTVVRLAFLMALAVLLVIGSGCASDSPNVPVTPTNIAHPGTDQSPPAEQQSAGDAARSSEPAAPQSASAVSSSSSTAIAGTSNTVSASSGSKADVSQDITASEPTGHAVETNALLAAGSSSVHPPGEQEVSASEQPIPGTPTELAADQHNRASLQLEAAEIVAGPVAASEAPLLEAPAGEPNIAQERTSEPPAASTPASETAVLLTIDTNSKDGKVLNSVEVELQKNDTVLDVTKRVTRANRIQMETKGTGAGAYVEGIDNRYEFDHGAKSGWVYRVNGTFPGNGAGSYKPQAGDRIEWIYTYDLGKDVGAKSP